MFAVSLSCSNEWPRKFSPTWRTTRTPGPGSTPSWSSLRTWKLKYVPDACRSRSREKLWTHLSGLLTVSQGQCNNVSWCLSVYPHQAEALGPVRFERSPCFSSTVLIGFSPANGSLLCLNLWLSAELLGFAFLLHLWCDTVAVMVILSVVSAVKM